MKHMRLAFTPLFLFIAAALFSQQTEYNSLLWQITGNGMQRPSYLYGTMHVSNKVAFHLGQPFFDAINSVDEVALEMDINTWLEDYIQSDEFNSNFTTNLFISDYGQTDPFERNLEMAKDQRDFIEAALSDDPAMINGFMFRQDKSKNDFQEDTYLDLYIYQTAKKYGKLTGGLETLAELDRARDNSDRAEAMEDHSVSSKGQRSWQNGEKLQEAYRRGDLHLLDSLNALSTTDSVREYIVFLRNIVMADRMSKIMKQHPLFTGVGAAHLPGARGVIELLRKKGYTVQAVPMGEIDADSRTKLEAKIVEKKFSSFTSPDGVFTVEVPEKMFCTRERAGGQDYLSADMANGIYFTVTRLKSYATPRRFSPERMLQMVDSLLYENIPGKIIEQHNIVTNGVKGIYIQNKTRKGDYQAYHIYATNDEVLFFKVSGTLENGKSEYAMHFLQSIILNVPAGTQWQTFTMPNQSFSVQMPGTPLSYLQHPKIYSASKIDLVAKDAQSGNTYMLVRTAISNPDYFEEDTFELSLMAYDFGIKNFYKEKNRRWAELNGRQALRVAYTTADSQQVAAMFVLQNLNYYALAAFYTVDSSMNEKFFSSLQFSNPAYSGFTTYVDSILHFKVQLPYRQIVTSSLKKFSYPSLNENPYSELSKSEIFSPPGAYEPIEVNYYQYSPFYQYKDTAEFIKWRRRNETYRFDFVVKSEKVKQVKDVLTIDYVLTDTNSTRQLLEHVVVKNGAKYVVSAFVDTLLGPSAYVKNFFETFQPLDTVIGNSLFANHGQLYLNGILSSDSLTRKHAMDESSEAEFNNETADILMKAVYQVPECADYQDIKVMLISKLKDVTAPAALPFLQKIYMASSDTAQFQFAVLKTLAEMKTPEAIQVFSKLLRADPPLSNRTRDVYEIFDPLYDSLGLAKALFPDLLDLSSIEEYKHEVYGLLARLVDSNMVKPAVYKIKRKEILSEARLELKRESGTRKTTYDNDDNYKIRDYNVLLLPYIKDAEVHRYFDGVLRSSKTYLRMATAIQLEKHKVPVHDSIWKNIALEDKYRVYLYNQLAKANLLNRYPAGYRTQAKFNEAVLRYSIQTKTNPLDTFVLLLNVPAAYRGTEGRVYLYKYKVAKDKDWKVALLGLQPASEKEVDGIYELKDTREYLDDHKTPQEQLVSLLYKLRKKKLRS